MPFLFYAGWTVKQTSPGMNHQVSMYSRVFSANELVTKKTRGENANFVIEWCIIVLFIQANFISITDGSSTEFIVIWACLIRVFAVCMKKHRPLTTYWAHSVDSDQTGWMPRLVRVFAGNTSFCWFCCAAAQIACFSIWYLYLHAYLLLLWRCTFQDQI